MAKFLRNKAVWAVGATVGVLYLVPKFSGNKSNVFETPGAQNIGDRWSAGGGAPTHTPAAATKRGDPNNVESPRQGPTDVTSKAFQESIASQRPGEASVPAAAEKAWNAAHYGQEKGK